MKIYDSITHIFKRGARLLKPSAVTGFGGWSGISCLPFADAVFLNCCELLTDLVHDVTWQFSGSNKALEVAFVRFFNTYGKLLLNTLYREGVVVVGHTSQGEGPAAVHEFHICQQREYTRNEAQGWVTYKSTDPSRDIYAIQSATYQTTGKSDRTLLRPFLDYLDNTLNASNTVAARMGACVIASPKNLNSAPTAIELDEDEKKELEKQMREEYGAVDRQSQVMVLPREMSFQVISLASLDLKTVEKVKLAVVAIADRLKVPANQVGLIDANSSKSLSNGSELREGDFNKYQSFERLLDQTFVQMARDCGLQPGAADVIQGEVVGSYYTIYNKPQQPAAANTATV